MAKISKPRSESQQYRETDYTRVNILQSAVSIFKEIIILIILIISKMT